jgi:hypothetical protein
MMKRLLSKTTLLAFATSGLIVSGAAASPVIDPPDAPLPPPLRAPAATVGYPVMDGWYSAAVAQTRFDRAKKHPTDRIIYRSSAPVSGHGPMLP